MCLDYHLQKFVGNLIRYCNRNTKEKKIYIIQNTFIMEIVKVWTQHTFESDIASNQIQTQCIWHTSHIRINNRLLFNKALARLWGIKY